MDQMANFMAGSLLGSIGAIVIVIAIVIINNIFARFWKPVKMFHYEVRFADQPEEGQK